MSLAHRHTGTSPAHWLIGALLFTAALLAPSNAAAAETLIDGTGALHAVKADGTPLGTCPLRHTSVSADISGFVARVLVTQTFANPYSEPIEAIYTFPLAEQGAVDAMWIRTADRVIRGEIKERDEARKIYEAARAEGKLAGLLDQERPNIFTQSIANLTPGATITVEIEYVEPLKYDSGAFAFAVPTVVGPRFVPGAPTGQSGSGWAPDTDQVPDASHITPPVAAQGTRAGHDIDIQVRVDAGVPILDLASPLHEIDVERDGQARATVRLRDRNEIPNRDFVLRYTVATEAVRSGYLSHRPEGKDGYVSLMLVPPRRVSSETAAPKEMIFVIDRSGSQSGRPLQKAQETMHWILDHMNPNDTFQIVDFGNTANVLFDKPAPASAEMKRQARAHIDALQANGGTMMAEAVRTVCALPADQHRLRVVVFMTDGYIGNDFEVLSLVRELRGTSRWFPFGTGNSVNRFLLEGMAREGGGEVEYVMLNDPGEVVARRFWERIGSPVLTDVKLEVQGLDLYDLHPNQVADVWAERPLIIHGRYHTAGQGRVVLRGYQQGAPYEQALEITLPERADDNAAVASMWARAAVDSLMARDLAALQSGQFPTPLKQKIVALALEHRLMTQFTSFVAVEDRVVNEAGQQHTVTVPVEMPDGVRYEGIFGPAAEADRAAAPAMAQRLLGSGMARGLAAGIDGGGVLSLEGGRAMKAPGEARRPYPVAAALKDEAKQRLSPELQTIFASGPVHALVEIIGDEVRIKVVLANLDPDTIAALEAAGLHIDQQLADAVVGRIAITKLPALAEIDAVTQVTLPDA